MLTVAQDFEAKIQKFDEINICGDFCDFFWFSLHPKMPEMMSIKDTLKDEISCARKMLAELRELFPSATINFIEGNHEYRMLRYIINKCPELFDMFSVPELLNLQSLGIRFFPFGRNQLFSCCGTNYYLRHQPYNGGKHCAATSIANKHISIGFGHTHRIQSYVTTDALGNEIEAHSMGWLGDPEAAIFAYMDHDTWAQGFQIFHAFSQEDWHVENVRIKNGTAIYNGVKYVG